MNKSLLYFQRHYLPLNATGTVGFRGLGPKVERAARRPNTEEPSPWKAEVEPGVRVQTGQARWWQEKAAGAGCDGERLNKKQPLSDFNSQAMAARQRGRFLGIGTWRKVNYYTCSQYLTGPAPCPSVQHPDSTLTDREGRATSRPAHILWNPPTTNTHQLQKVCLTPCMECEPKRKKNLNQWCLFKTTLFAAVFRCKCYVHNNGKHIHEMNTWNESESIKYNKLTQFSWHKIGGHWNEKR